MRDSTAEIRRTIVEKTKSAPYYGGSTPYYGPLLVLVFVRTPVLRTTGESHFGPQGPEDPPRLPDRPRGQEPEGPGTEP